MLAAILEMIFQVVLEFVFEAIVEILSELGLNVFEKTSKSKTLSPVLRGVTYLVVGTLLGVLSYFVIPVHVLQNTFLRIVGMILSPISMGLMLCLVSWIVSRKDRNEAFWSTEKFIHGVVSGASYSMARAVAVG